MPLEETILNVITLNAWGLPQPWPIGSTDRKYRFSKLGQELAAGAYDIVALQEVWSEKDYVRLQEDVRLVLPYSHYFYSGVIGSGVCIFSRYPIVETLMHRYSLNGFAHHIHRGDWFGGKVVGMAQILIRKGGQDIVANVYSTHIHAEYNSQKDLYLAHRVVQCFELGQFVKHTSSKADLVLLMGDFNVEPDGLSYRLILANSDGLKDVWTSKPANPAIDSTSNGSTCDRPDNVYAAKMSLKEAPQGKRIDYILYHSDSDSKVRVIRAENRLNRIPGEEHRNFSDHVGVWAEFGISQRSTHHQSVSVETALGDGLKQPALPPLRPLLPHSAFVTPSAGESTRLSTSSAAVAASRRYGSVEAVRPVLGKAIQIVEDAEARASFDVKVRVCGAGDGLKQQPLPPLRPVLPNSAFVTPSAGESTRLSTSSAAVAASRYGSVEAVRPVLGKAIQVVEDAEERASFDVKVRVCGAGDGLKQQPLPPLRPVLPNSAFVTPSAGESTRLSTSSAAVAASRYGSVEAVRPVLGKAIQVVEDAEERASFDVKVRVCGAGDGLKQQPLPPLRPVLPNSAFVTPSAGESTRLSTSSAAVAASRYGSVEAVRPVLGKAIQVVEDAEERASFDVKVRVCGAGDGLKQQPLPPLRPVLPNSAFVTPSAGESTRLSTSSAAVAASRRYGSVEAVRPVLGKAIQVVEDAEERASFDVKVRVCGAGDGLKQQPLPPLRPVLPNSAFVTPSAGESTRLSTSSAAVAASRRYGSVEAVRPVLGKAIQVVEDAEERASFDVKVRVCGAGDGLKQQPLPPLRPVLPNSAFVTPSAGESTRLSTSSAAVAASRRYGSVEAVRPVLGKTIQVVEDAEERASFDVKVRVCGAGDGLKQQPLPPLRPVLPNSAFVTPSAGESTRLSTSSAAVAASRRYGSVEAVRPVLGKAIQVVEDAEERASFDVKVRVCGAGDCLKQQPLPPLRPVLPNSAFVTPSAGESTRLSTSSAAVAASRRYGSVEAVRPVLGKAIQVVEDAEERASFDVKVRVCGAGDGLKQQPLPPLRPVLPNSAFVTPSAGESTRLSTSSAAVAASRRYGSVEAVRPVLGKAIQVVEDAEERASFDVKVRVCGAGDGLKQQPLPPLRPVLPNSAFVTPSAGESTRLSTSSAAVAASRRYGSVEAVRPVLSKAIQIVEDAEERASFDVKLYAVVIALLMLLFILALSLEVEFPAYTILVVCARVLLTVTIAFCVWYGLIGLKLEQKALKASRLGMRIILQYRPPAADS